MDNDLKGLVFTTVIWAGVAAFGHLVTWKTCEVLLISWEDMSETEKLRASRKMIGYKRTDKIFTSVVAVFIGIAWLTYALTR